MKLKGFSTAEETVNQLKRQPTERGGKSLLYTYDREMASRIYEELRKTKHQENTVSNLKKKRLANETEERLLKKKKIQGPARWLRR